MGKEKNIASLLRSITGEQNSNIIIATVDDGSVNGNYCDVTPVDGAPLKRVRLKAKLDDESGIVCTPADGSVVIVTMISRLDAYISMFSEIVKVKFLQGNTDVVLEDSKITIHANELELNMEGNKMNLKNSVYDLKSALNDIITEINAAIITTPAGPGAVSPTTIAKLQAINEKINQLLS
ncbi:MAG: hypothetical protein RBR64_09045 [Bacteroidales bacterium]|jgi:hypothetical protein|nr:hypothetical protein [Bacteroidales bacterium]